MLVCSFTLYFYNAYLGTNIEAVSDLLRDIIVILVDSFIVVFLIERIYQIEKEKERVRLEKLALNQLKQSIKEYVCVFIKMIIVSQPDN
jgi:hypothetical protein